MGLGTKNIHIAVMDRLVSGHRGDLIKPLGTPFLGGKRKVTLGKSALSDSLFGHCQR